MKAHNKHFPMIDITSANFTVDDLQRFQKEVVATIKSGLFPFADPDKNGVGSSFEISGVGFSDDKKRAAFSIKCTQQGLFGSEDDYDIRTNDSFRFTFYRNDVTKSFTHFSTNLSSEPFRILMIPCKETSLKLYHVLKNTGYPIIDSSTLSVSDTDLLKSIHAYVAAENTYKKKSATGFYKKYPDLIKQNLNIESVVEYFKTHPRAQAKMDSRYEAVMKASFKRADKKFGSLDFGEFKKEFKDPLNKERMRYVAECEILQQLQQATIGSTPILKTLPHNPVILDVGSSSGLNLAKIDKAVPTAIMLGIEPAKTQADIAKKAKIPTYQGFLEDIPPVLHGKIDLVTIFNINLGSDCSSFYATLPKLLSTNGKLVVGVSVRDFPITLSRRTVLDHLKEHFKVVQEMPNPQDFTQTLYVASGPKLALSAGVAASSALVDGYKAHMQKFVDDQKTKRVKTAVDQQNEKVLDTFLDKVNQSKAIKVQSLARGFIYRLKNDPEFQKRVKASKAKPMAGKA